MDTNESTQARLLSALERARGVAEANARRSERERTLAGPVVEALRDGDLLRMCVPRALGGLECDARTQLAVFERAARVDGAFGWCVMIAALHNAMAGAYLPDAGVDEVFAGGAMPTCAGLVTPSGLARPAAGGYVLTGRWAFGSGIRHAQWVVATAVIEGTDAEGALPEFVQALVPRAEVLVEDTWHAAGLRGTGSEHYRLEGVFVPARRTYAFPVAPARRGGPLYELPLVALLAPGHAGFALGVAQRALDEAVAAAPRRMRLWTRTMQGEHGAFLMDLGRASAKLAAARALAENALVRAEEVVRAGDALSTDDWAAVRLAVTYATDVAVEVVPWAFRAAGSGALFDEHPLQRCLRDVYAAAQHVAATDDAYEFAGRVLVGTPLFNPMLLPRPARG